MRDLHAGPGRGEAVRGGRPRAAIPGKLLAYNCSPSFNWEKKLDASTIAHFQRELGAMGYKFQFVTLAGFHALNFSMFELARDYRERGMARTRPCSGRSSRPSGGLHRDQAPARGGHRLLRQVAEVISGGDSSSTALQGSTEADQFH